MLRINHLNGFWNQAATAGTVFTAGEQPVLPTNAWPFDDSYDIRADIIGTAPNRPLSLAGSYGAGLPSRRGQAISMEGSGENGSVGVDGSLVSVSGWIFPTGSDELDFVRLTAADGSYVKIITSQTTASTFSVWCKWYDGDAAFSQYEMLTSQSINDWYFFGISASYASGAKAVRFYVNDTSYSSVSNVPDATVDTLDFNTEDTGSNASFRDELYFWQGTYLSQLNYQWLYKNGSGRFVQGTGINASW